MPTVGQASRQLKQPMHAAKSISFELLLMQFALQTRSHNPHSLQLFSSITILKNENLERSPRTAPAGQSKLQNSLP